MAGKSKQTPKTEPDPVLEAPLELDSDEAVLGNIALQ